MSHSFQAVKVTEKVYWVGAIDWELREFHGYQTQRGTTYNAYLILADKITLLDTVKAPFHGEMMARIRSLIDPKQISQIVSHHSEMDHSGSLPEAIREIEPEIVVVSTMGAKALARHFQLRDLNIVKSGEILSLGNAELIFQETRMLHWPDSMISYLPSEKVLFSQDGFGMHLAGNERFTDEVEEPVWMYEAAKYYANILTPFSPLVLELAKKLGELKWPIQIVAPDHGPIWRNGPEKIVNLYGRWATQKPTNKAVIAYDTMWKSTATMAHVVASGISDHGAKVRMVPLSACHRSDLATELLEAGALIVGSPTMNNMVYPTVADALTYLKGLKFKGLLGAAFGSYGWSGEAVAQINEYLDAMKIERVDDGVKAQYVPDHSDLDKCYQLGAKIGVRLREFR